MEKNKIFLGNVAYGTTQEMLTEIFAEYGEIEEVYKPVGKGFAFVTFKSDESAAAAVEGANGKEVDGRELVVDFAKPKKERSDRF